jgi:hypothetical protein
MEKLQNLCLSSQNVPTMPANLHSLFSKQNYELAETFLGSGKQGMVETGSSLCSPSWSQTGDPPASAFQVLGLQPYTTMPCRNIFVIVGTGI